MNSIFLTLSWTVCLFAIATEAAEPPVAITLPGEPGPYTVTQWKRDWPGCEFEDGVKQGRIILVNRGGSPSLRVNYTAGQIGPELNGAGWRWPFGRRDAAELSYTVRFSRDFDWVKGGKLPGLSGGPENVSGGHPANGTNGFSVRLMWRKDGRGEAYVYHKNQKGEYGDSFSFPEDLRYPTETPVRVRERVTMNDAGQRNGTLQVWITLGDGAERLVVERADLEWRSANTFGVDSIYFETFHGGGDSSWAPARACWAEFGDFRIAPAAK